MSSSPDQKLKQTLAKVDLKVNESEKDAVQAYIDDLIKRLLRNIVINAIDIKKMTSKKPDEKVLTFEDMNKMQEIMNWVKFFTRLKFQVMEEDYEQEGSGCSDCQEQRAGFYSPLPLPLVYFMPDAPDHGYGTGYTSPNPPVDQPIYGLGVGRPPIEAHFPGVSQEGGVYARNAGVLGVRQAQKMMGNMRDYVIGKDARGKYSAIRFVTSDQVPQILEQVHDVKVEDKRVLRTLAESVNQNLRALFAYYRELFGARAYVNSNKLQDVAETDPLFEHISPISK